MWPVDYMIGWFANDDEVDLKGKKSLSYFLIFLHDMVQGTCFEYIKTVVGDVDMWLSKP